MDKISNEIKEYIARNILFSENGFPYNDEDSFLNEGIIDSIGVLELVGFVEETYQVTVDDLEIIPDNFDSVNNLAGFVRRKMSRFT